MCTQQVEPEPSVGDGVEPCEQGSLQGSPGGATREAGVAQLVQGARIHQVARPATLRTEPGREPLASRRVVEANLHVRRPLAPPLELQHVPGVIESRDKLCEQARLTEAADEILLVQPLARRDDGLPASPKEQPPPAVVGQAPAPA